MSKDSKFYRIGSYEMERIARRISIEVQDIAKSNNLQTEKGAKALALYVMGQYENYRKELGL